MSHICHCICNYVIWDKYLMAHMYQRVYQSPTTSRGWLDGGWNYKSLVAMANQSTIYIYIYIWTHIYIHSMYTFPYSLWFLFLQLLTTCLFLCEKTSQAFSIMANISAMLLKTGLGEKGTAMDARWNNKAIDEMVSRQEIYVYLPHGLK